MISRPSPLSTKRLAWRGCCVIVTFSFLTAPFSRMDTCFQQERRWRAPFFCNRTTRFFATLYKIALQLERYNDAFTDWPYIAKMLIHAQRSAGQRESVAR